VLDLGGGDGLLGAVLLQLLRVLIDVLEGLLNGNEGVVDDKCVQTLSVQWVVPRIDNVQDLCETGLGPDVANLLAMVRISIQLLPVAAASAHVMDLACLQADGTNVPTIDHATRLSGSKDDGVDDTVLDVLLHGSSMGLV